MQLVGFIAIFALIGAAGWRAGAGWLSVMAGFIGFLPAFFFSLDWLDGGGWQHPVSFWAGGAFLAAIGILRRRMRTDDEPKFH